MDRCVAIFFGLVLWAGDGLSPVPVTAQGTNVGPVVIGEQVSFHSDALGEDRLISIYTPDGYAVPGTSYPVLYVTDGEVHFHHVSGIVQFLARTNSMPKMIVVAIHNMGQESRGRDLIPPLSSGDRARRSGAADEFLEFITDELMPWVESQYRTDPFRVLVGHSLGGLFATYALVEAPGVFDAFVSMSPSLGWDGGSLTDRVAAMLTDRPDMRGSLFMSMANEGSRTRSNAEALLVGIKASTPTRFRTAWRPLPAEDHVSVTHRSIYDGLEWIFEGWFMGATPEAILMAGEEGMEEVRLHYRGLLDRFGSGLRPPEVTLERIGRLALQLRNTAGAIALLEMNAEYHGDSPGAHAILGEAYAAACRLADAQQSYGVSYRLALETRPREDDERQRQLDSVEDRIDSGRACVPSGEHP